MARPGPFPGMDPWLESRWAGVHHLLISFIQRQLNPQLRAIGLVARIDERVYVESTEGWSRVVRPDVHVVRSPVAPKAGGVSTDGGVALLDEPYVIALPSESPTVDFVEIVDAADQSKVITAIEVLSPTNKIDPRARREYRSKRDAYHAAGVNTVEVDLLRDGDPLTDVTLDRVPANLRAPYAVWVYRAYGPRGPQMEYYPAALRSPLPRFAVPLRETDADARLDLQAALDAAYDQGSYDLTDYNHPPAPPLGEEDAVWAAEQVAAWRAMIS